ncbi:MAG: hypothetical protein KBI47_18595 [Armatimonadetes bacterium]|nr:hypothetical protein [Armatimonadota bacterium]
MPAGNRSVLVVLDSRRRAERALSDTTVFAALDHFGVPWEVLECGDYMPQPPDHITPRALYVLAHDGAGAGLTDSAATEIAEAVAAGAGLVSMDREVNAWPSALRALAPNELHRTETAVLRFPSAPNFVTFGHEQDEELQLDAPISVTTFRAGDGCDTLLATSAGEPALVRRQMRQGRVILFGTGERLYGEDVFGHVQGADGLLWRAMIWAAKKPFAMRCIPPFVTARMDDCNGTYGAFAYVDVMNRFGIKPNLGLFIDEMGPSDWAAAKRLFDAGGADFSMHAFRDDFYKARANYKPFAVSPDKPDLSDGGKVTVFEGLSLDHNTGRDLDSATVRRNFQRMDEAFAKAGIRHSRVINAHFGEIAWRAVPLFLERGVDMPCNNSVVGQLYGNQPAWRPGPYGSRGRHGRFGLVIERCPYASGLTFINMSVSHASRTHMTGDILSGRVPFLGESETPKVAEAAAQGVRNIKLGLDALAFGVLMTHEERIDAISPDDWETVVTSIVRGLDGWDVEFAGREHVGIITKRLYDSRLVRAEYVDGGMQCELVGVTDGPSPLTIWDNEGDGCVRRVVEIDRLDGFAEVRV